MNHTPEQCKEFKKLPVSGKKGRYEMLKQVNTCFKCFSNHTKQNCPKKHVLHVEAINTIPSCVHHRKTTGRAPQRRKPKKQCPKSQEAIHWPCIEFIKCQLVTVVKRFLFSVIEGLIASYITHHTAERIKAKKIKKLSLM